MIQRRVPGYVAERAHGDLGPVGVVQDPRAGVSRELPKFTRGSEPRRWHIPYGMSAAGYRRSVQPAGQAVPVPTGINPAPIRQSGASATTGFVLAVAGGLIAYGALAYVLTRAGTSSSGGRRRRSRRR